MESITDFIKVSIPHRVEDSISEILHTAVQIPAQSLTVKLQTFETEYHVMHEIMATFHMKESSSSISDTNELLRKQNKDLIEQLAVCRGAILRLESIVTSLNERVEEQEKRLEKYNYLEIIISKFLFCVDWRLKELKKIMKMLNYFIVQLILTRNKY